MQQIMEIKVELAGENQADELEETAVLPRLKTKWLGHSYHYSRETGSTHDDLKTLVASSQPVHGVVLLTNYQNAGRGRLNRPWLAPPGSSLLFSWLLRPNWPAERMQWLTMFTCVALVEAVEVVTGVKMGIKWPNDGVVEQNGRFFKLAGLLLEGNLTENGRLQHAILGLGLNVNTPPHQLPEAITPPTSLFACLGRPVSRLSLLLELLQRLETAYEMADGGQSPQPAWQKHLVTLGQPVQVTQMHSQTTVTGTAELVDEWGQLGVRDETGTLHMVAAGDVTLRRLQ